MGMGRNPGTRLVSLQTADFRFQGQFEAGTRGNAWLGRLCGWVPIDNWGLLREAG